jgi:hypothetical protein
MSRGPLGRDSVNSAPTIEWMCGIVVASTVNGQDHPVQDQSAR